MAKGPSVDPNQEKAARLPLHPGGRQVKMELYLALTDLAVTSSTGDGQLFRALKPLVQRKGDEEAEWSSQKGPKRH